MAVLGVDACKAGWAGVVLTGGQWSAGVFARDLTTLLLRARAAGDIDVIGIDMPIGLPDVGPRRADELARSRVGPRRSSVFSAPTRAALAELTHASASQVNVALTGKGISRQAYGLKVKLLEVDSFASTSEVRVVEVHPEVSFATMAGAHLASSKKTWAGAVLRQRILATHGIDPPMELGELGDMAAPDDVLDAAAAAWSADRVGAGTATAYPDPPEEFADHHQSAIWA